MTEGHLARALTDPLFAPQWPAEHLERHSPPEINWRHMSQHARDPYAPIPWPIRWLLILWSIALFHIGKAKSKAVMTAWDREQARTWPARVALSCRPLVAWQRRKLPHCHKCDRFLLGNDMERRLCRACEE